MDETESPRATPPTITTDSLPATPRATAPPLFGAGMVPHLLDQSRKFRAMYFRTLDRLEEQSVAATGRGRVERWMDENFGDAMRLAPKMMMKEPEAAPHATVEDLLDQLDQRAAKAKIIEG